MERRAALVETTQEFEEKTIRHGWVICILNI